MLEDYAKNRVDGKKPRKEGRTYVIDKLQGLDKENFEALAPFVDAVKIYGVLPLILPEPVLQRKIKFYQDLGVKVSTGSTISEYMVAENAFDKFVAAAATIGFDIIEIGENSLDLTFEQKKKITDAILAKNLEFQWKVGKKDPRHQLSIDTVTAKVEEAVKLGSDKVVLEANEGVNVGIYDEKGAIKWNFVGALTAKFPPNTFIFEAPLEHQQSALIAEFGQRVNLAEIHVDAVSSIESQRRGFPTKASFSVSYLRKEPEGGPGAKFVYFIIKTRHPIDQVQIMEMSRLPRRTVQSAIDELKNQGLIIERSSLDDARKKVYSPVQSIWL
ncbi:phosphosulfolactate synthase [Candidatus Nitrososphaera gargensis Ga9.2]|uniref:Phosphosulfolactate synthase n=1 Tax=Nitrososphaera gargensis (strain Ga9.2) TaxID=1237085 RepID=K0IIQ2_NITGG|nr:phosphosulfolactate synthase [Candidatus Nitrososphaera gargensis]AFU57982.1 phosphosulfolactate synthase [Candidatus Nitrososphaera gargensis Ga9.2]